MTKFKPLWSIDIEKTEVWLGEMAARGNHLVAINLLTRIFAFEKGAPEDMVFRISHDKNPDPSLSPGMEDQGWELVLHQGRWVIAANAKPEDEIKAFPVRDGLVRRNRVLAAILGGISMYCLLTTMMALVFTLIFALKGDSVTFVSSPLWTITALYWTLMLGFAWVGLKLVAVNRRFIGDRNPVPEPESEGPMQRGIVKWKFAWHYSPDKLEQWLEQMERKGYNLQRIGKLGVSFHFSRGSSRTVKYCADYQNSTNQSYFMAHREAGWKLVFASPGSLVRWSLWAQEYSPQDHPPRFYSDKSSLLQHARRVAFTHAGLFLFLIVVYLLNITMMLNSYLTGRGTVYLPTLIIFSILILEFSTFTVRTLLYYRRLKSHD